MHYFVLIFFFDFCGFISVAYTTLNKLLAVFFIYNFLIASCGSSSHITRSAAVISSDSDSSVVGSDGWICPASSGFKSGLIGGHASLSMKSGQWAARSLEINALKTKSRVPFTQTVVILHKTCFFFVARFILNNPWNFHTKTLCSFEDIEDFVGGWGLFFAAHYVYLGSRRRSRPMMTDCKSPQV